MKRINRYATTYLIDGIHDGEYGPDAETEHEVIDCRPDWDDLLDGECSIDLAARAILDAGITQDNGDGSFYNPDGSYVSNYGTGEECAESMHLQGFSEVECALVSDRVEAELDRLQQIARAYRI